MYLEHLVGLMDLKPEYKTLNHIWDVFCFLSIDISNHKHICSSRECIVFKNNLFILEYF